MLQQEEYEHDDGWLHSWEQELLAENEQIALQASLLGEPGSSSQTNGTARPGMGQGKKKKAKKITLMSTNARRAA